jgi:signal transduction histidine kinase
MTPPRPTDAWTAVRLAPWRFLISSWPWRSVLYLGTSALLALLLIPLVTATVLLLPLWGILLGKVERARLRLVGIRPIASPHIRIGWDRRGAWAGVRLGEPGTWREVAYLIVAMVFGVLSLAVLVFAAICVAVPVAVLIEASRRVLRINLWGDVWVVNEPANALGLVLCGALALGLLAYVAMLVVAAQSAIARALLSPRQEELERQVARLTLSRLSLVNAFESERRRIERDLHDGAQQQLVAVSMTLGIAELELADAAAQGADVGSARRLVAQAHDQAERALGALRDTVRGVHPQVLIDHGITAAIGELTGRLPLHVSVAIDLDRRMPDAVEATAYFTVSEALTNVIRHSNGTRVEVCGGLTAGSFWLSVRDDGAGGANLAGGTGLAGLSERAEALGGRFALDSPAGGPTIVRLDLPVPAGELAVAARERR